MQIGEFGPELGKLILYWDYDTQWAADRTRQRKSAASWGQLDFENTDRLLEIHERYQVPACFAVVGAAALDGSRPYHDPGQIRRIHAMGHEIASHSMRHEWLPGLRYSELLQTVRESKDALEQCVGGRVLSFVPPFNQPFDYPSKLSFSLSERRMAPSHRIDVPRLINALAEAGYLSCRVSYSSVFERLYRRVLKRRWRLASEVLTIAGVACIRLKARAGFRGAALAALDHCVESNELAVVYGHPHSLGSGNAQDEKFLTFFLGRVRELVRSDRLKVILPGELAAAKR